MAANPKKIGCLLLLALMGLMVIEVWVWMLASQGLNRAFGSAIGSGGWLITSGWIIAMLVIGIKLGRWHASRIMTGLLTGQAGRHLVGVVGAILLGIPGLLTDIPGLLLCLPPVQRLFGTLGSALVASIAKRAMGGAFGAGGNPLMRGFPGGAAFPGMKQLTPDDLVTFKKPGSGPKTYDVKPESDR